MSNNTYPPHRIFSGEETISGDKVIWYPILNGDRKYSLQFEWAGNAQGKVSIVTSNDRNQEYPLADNAGGFLETTITAVTGSDYLNDYQGVVTKLVGVKFTGVDATFKWTLNFTR